MAKTKLVCEASAPIDDDEANKDGVARLASHGGCGNPQPQIRKEGLKLFGSWKKSSKDPEAICLYDVANVRIHPQRRS